MIFSKKKKNTNMNSTATEETETLPTENTASPVEETALPDADQPLIAELESLSAELNEWKDRYLRLQADFDNARKRSLKDIENARTKAQEEFLSVLLPIIDQIELGIKASETSDNLESLREGLKLMQKNVTQAVGKMGLQPIEALGQAFDSEFHEAIAQVPTDDPELKGKIMEEIRKGYLYKEKVLRYAQVIIGE
jgi:molecular chaperone GrpE